VRITLIVGLRESFNAAYSPEQYEILLSRLDRRAGTRIEFRIAETPIFLPKELLEELASAGIALTARLLAWPEYLAAASSSIPPAFRVAGESPHPHFLTADFALAHDADGNLAPRLVEIQAFPSVYAYQVALAEEYASVFDLPVSDPPDAGSLGIFLGGHTRASFEALFRQTVLGSHSAENVVLLEIDPWGQKTLPDFLLTATMLGIPIVDITTVVPVGDKLHYRNAAGDLKPIHRIYNRAIADEMISRGLKLPFDLTANWKVEWAGHPNWYFLISKYSVPWLSLPEAVTGHTDPVVPPAVFLEDFLAGPGEERLRAACVSLPESGKISAAADTVYDDLLLKPLFSFAGKGIQFAPSRAELLAIPEEERGNYLLQQKMHFVPTIETPFGLTQAEVRILYLWPDGGDPSPVLPLVRLGRGKMMGVDHNRDKEWVGASAAFWR
jgi:hypothetical protein